MKWTCLAVSVGSIVTSMGLLWMSSETGIPEGSPPLEVENTRPPQANVEKPLIVERKGEKIIWRLQADAAKQQEQGMFLTKPKLELFTEAGEMIPVQAHQAWFEPIKKNIRFKGSVKVRYREWTLNSEELYYDHTRDQAVVPGKFEAKKTDMTLRGQGLHVDRKTQRLTVEHDVWLEDSASQLLGNQP